MYCNLGKLNHQLRVEEGTNYVRERGLKHASLLVLVLGSGFCGCWGRWRRRGRIWRVRGFGFGGDGNGKWLSLGCGKARRGYQYLRRPESEPNLASIVVSCTAHQPLRRRSIHFATFHWVWERRTWESSLVFFKENIVLSSST